MTAPPNSMRRKKAAVSVEEAKADPSGAHCPAGTEFPCVSIGAHTEWSTPSGRVYARCAKCQRPFILRDHA